LPRAVLFHLAQQLAGFALLRPGFNSPTVGELARRTRKILRSPGWNAFPGTRIERDICGGSVTTSSRILIRSVLPQFDGVRACRSRCN
jgi:hypothetical protein